MSSVWVIVGTANVETDLETGPPEPTVCGVYRRKEEAAEEIIKLLVEDDLSQITEADSPTTDKPRTVKDIKRQRKYIMSEEVSSSYSLSGNIYTLIQCDIGTRHSFSREVKDLYKKTVSSGNKSSSNKSSGNKSSGNKSSGNKLSGNKH